MDKTTSLSPLDREICELAHQLDEVHLQAFLATAKAMAAGLDNVAALALGNIVLVSLGYPPAPVYIPQNGHTGGETAI